MTLDHLIAVVPDLKTTHRRLIDAGFEEAWPPGPFWPGATTSGIALGGANLELYQPAAGASHSRIETIVLAPSSLDEGRKVLDDLGLAYEEHEKIEPDPALLALRGFPPDLTATPQTICVNHLPVDPPFRFFLCSYAPFLRERLASSAFSQPRGSIIGLTLRALEPEAVRRLFAGHLGPIELNVEPGETNEVSEILFSDGSALTAQDL
jgi:hypothetical protein